MNMKMSVFLNGSLNKFINLCFKKKKVKNFSNTIQITSHFEDRQIPDLVGKGPYSRKVIHTVLHITL